MSTSVSTIVSPVSAREDLAHDTPAACLAAIEEFTRFGFRRTSMVGLADAVGVSRQTLYNRFGNKEAVLAWAVDGVAISMRDDALACLNRGQGSEAPANVLQEVFWRWLGTIAVLLHRHQHAEEIFGLSKAELARKRRDPLEGLSAELISFLLREKLRADKSAASDAAFLLAMAAKGLMHSCGTEEAFRAGMARVLAGMGIR